MAVKVNEHLIPDWAVERQAQSLFEQVAKTMPDKPREVVQLAALDLARDRMIDQALMAQESQRRDYKIDPEELKLGMKKWISENGGKKAFSKGKHPVIKTQEDLEKEIINQIQFNRLLEEISDCDAVTEDEAKKYYDARPDLFESEVLLTASHILKMAKTEDEQGIAEAKIIDLRKRVLDGEDFVELVRAESDDAQNDGHLGTFGKGRMVEPFEKAVFELKPEEISDPVQTQFGWHLIKLHDRKEPEITPFEEVKDKITEYLGERRKDSVFDEFLDQLKKNAEITEVAGF
jgi:parvulin-like peptidyl-prolyl isomerase